MKTLDITFDLETCALCPTAAVMSIGAVAWNRDNHDTPFFIEPRGEMDPTYLFAANVDLRGMFIDGFTFDLNTASWWAAQSEEAKRAVRNNTMQLDPIDVIIDDFFAWIEEMKALRSADSVCLWCQGSDFDISILKNICHRYHKTIPVDYTCFRDHRTFFLESARIICTLAGTEFDPRKAYTMVDPYPGAGAAHEPLYDCRRSIYSTWQMMKHISCLPNKSLAVRV